MQKPLIYVSTDIETDGPAIGKNSMLSLASAAFSEEKKLINTFTINLETLPDGTEDPNTMLWWEKYPNAWQAARKDCVSPTEGMRRYVSWLKQLPGRPIFVATPIAFDFSFVVYYLERFARENPFGFAAIDIRSVVMGFLKIPFAKANMSQWPKHWFEDKVHTHIALDDAIEQGTAFCNILKELQLL